MKYLVTGGCGFVGSNLAAEILKNGDELVVFDNLFRQSTDRNLNWLKSLGNFKFYHSDIRNYNDVENVIKSEMPDVIFHLAGQVAMTTSLENPRLDFETNVLGTINVLECIRKFTPETIILYSSTNKVYGDLGQFTYTETDFRYSCNEHPKGFDESIQLEFHSPYGCSKGAADQYLLDYYRMYNIRSVVFRHSSMYGGRQFSTKDQGWIGWFCKKAYEKKHNVSEEPFTISGTGKQVRDVLYSTDLINCYFSAVKYIEDTKGNVYNIGGGYDNSFSLLELFKTLEDLLNIKMNYRPIAWRSSDQKVFIADISKAEKDFNWKPFIDKYQGLELMYKWIERIDE